MSWVALGSIRGVHGVRGVLKVHSDTEPPEAIARYPLWLEKIPEREPIWAQCLGVQPKGILLRFKAVTDRTAAEMLIGKTLYTQREHLAAVESGDVYLADLIGLKVVAAETNAILGEVTACHDYGAGTIIEVRPSAGGEAILLPFSHCDHAENLSVALDTWQIFIGKEKI